MSLSQKCAVFKEVSAKDGIGVSEIMQKLGEEMSTRQTNVSTALTLLGGQALYVRFHGHETTGLTVARGF